MIALGVLRSAELGDVGAGGEDLLAARDHDRAGRVGGQLLGDVVELAHERAREGVDLAVAQRDDRDPVRAAFQFEQLCHARQSVRPRVGPSGDLPADGDFRRRRTHPGWV